MPSKRKIEEYSIQPFEDTYTHKQPKGFYSSNIRKRYEKRNLNTLIFNTFINKRYITCSNRAKILFLHLSKTMNSGSFRHLPNFITCLNLACGCFALVFIFKGEIEISAILVGASLIFDFLDGFAARALKSNSLMGKELDSLADMVTFGLVPGVYMYQLFIKSVPLVLNLNGNFAQIISFFPFIITVFSALRLAKFNIDTRQQDSFLGMPTPAITIFVTGLALIIENDRFHLTPMLLNTYVLGGLSMILSFLLVSEIPLFALKFKSFSWAANKAQYILLATGIILIASLQYLAIPLLIIFYLILSLINKPKALTSDSLKSIKP